MTVVSLANLMAYSLQSSRLNASEAKYIARLMEKLRYCKEVLHSIHDADKKREAQESESIPGLAPAARAATTVGLEARNALEAARGALEAGRAGRGTRDRDTDIGYPRPMSVVNDLAHVRERDAGGSLRSRASRMSMR